MQTHTVIFINSYVLLCLSFKLPHCIVIKSKNEWQKITFYSFSFRLKPEQQDAGVFKVKPRLLNLMQEANETGRGNQAIPVSTNTLLPVCCLHLPHVTSDETKKQ